MGSPCTESHILITNKTSDALFRLWLNGIKKVNYKIRGNPSCHVLQRVENNGPYQLLIGHKRTGDEGI